MLAAWLLFPAVLLAIALGCGLLVERVSRVDLPGVLLVPTGFSLVLVVARLTTEKDSTAGLALPLVLLFAVAGLVLGRKRLRRPRLDVWAAAAAVGVFAVFGAPVFLSGEPTIAGSIVLPDTAGHLAVASFVADHGHAWQQLPESSYRNLLKTFLKHAYPVAGQSTLGVLAPLGVVDLAWLYQPFLTFAAALTAPAIYSLLEPVIQPRRWRALAAFVVAQPALLVGFALQGSIKEVSAVALVALSAALAARARPTAASAGALLPFAVAVAAALGVLGTPAAAYAAPLVLWVLALWTMRVVRSGSHRQLTGLGVAALFGLAVALPIVLSAGTSFRVTKTLLADRGGLGNLAAPLHLRQVAGIWLDGDYRYAPDGSDLLGWGLIALMAAAAVFGVVWMIRRRAVPPLLLLVSLGVVAIPLALEGNPYADAKVLALASPAVVLAAAVGVWGLRGVARGIPAVALAAVLTGGVLLSNALAYHDSRHAPYHRYAELIRIDDRFAGRGPAISTDYDEYSAYLLRKLPGFGEPNHDLEWRHPALPTEPTNRQNPKSAADVEAVRRQYLETFPLLVLRRSPVTSRPPSSYHRVWHGRYYDVWQRSRRPLVTRHVPLGDGILQPAGRIPCRTIVSLGQFARSIRGRLAYVEVPRLSEVLPLNTRHPFYWHGYPAWPGAIVPVGQGDSQGDVSVPHAGRYSIWVEGSFGRKFTAFVDGRAIGSVANEEGYPGSHQLLGSVRLPAGRHVVRLFSGGGDLRPGNGGSASSLRHVGPVILSPSQNERRQIRELSPGRARTLCGRSFDWVEVVY